MRGIVQSHLGGVFIIVLLVLSMLGGVVLGQMMSSARLSSSGLVKSVGIGVYKDNNCSESVSSIEWGLVEPGSQHNVSIYIRNEGYAEITLFLNATDWNPAEAETYMVLSWNYTGQTLMPNQVTLVILALSVGNNAPIGRSFAFSIVISAVG